ncbi:MAG TPA: DUF4430 domain-containing protein [Solirubrobacterales bacterium]|nr:DUF4430 domain-containing protein [Solirubrobacterales bacterium]
MRRHCGTAVAIALFAAALATAGCGLGPGSGVGQVSLTVTRDYGAAPVLAPASEEASESDSVMSVLERDADITTRYGGGFVQSIDGLEAEERFDRSFDWFFYVNGVESTVGAADYPLTGGEAIWWDYRDWSAAMRVPAVVGSWPQPFRGGYDGKRRPVAVDCLDGGGACAAVRGALAAAGVSVSGGLPQDAIRVLVGPWGRVREDPAAAQIESGPQASGVFADFVRHGTGFGLVGLGVDGKPARTFGPAAGLVAATRRYEAPPTWVVTGVDEAGVRAAAGLLDVADLRGRYAVATEGGAETPLPIGAAR